MHNGFRLLRLHQKKTSEDEDEPWSNVSVGLRSLTERSPSNRMRTVERDPLYTERSLDNFVETVLDYLELNPITSGCLSLPDFVGLCPSCTCFSSGFSDLMLTILTAQTFDSHRDIIAATHP